MIPTASPPRHKTALVEPRAERNPRQCVAIKRAAARGFVGADVATAATGTVAAASRKMRRDTEPSDAVGGAANVILVKHLGDILGKRCTMQPGRLQVLEKLKIRSPTVVTVNREASSAAMY